VFRVVTLLIAGSIATDHLMSFPGKFADSLVVDQLDKLSVSFLVEELEVRRGGCAANICFGLGNLGLRPVLVGAVGEDFADYRAWLERHNVDCDSVHVSETKHTARFVCTNDASMAQIASFYAGAMSESREMELKPIADRVGEPTYVLIGPDDPQGMLRHTDECRQRGYRFVADPSQQLAFGDGDLIRPLIDGADILFSNEYEASLITQKTGWSRDDILARVGTWVVTLGAAGVRIDRKGEESITVGAVPEIRKVEPTGVGPGPRARRPARLPARGARRGAGRHPGVRAVPDRVPRAVPQHVRRRRRRRPRAAPADVPPVIEDAQRTR
jgi:adenosine kinase